MRRLGAVLLLLLPLLTLAQPTVINYSTTPSGQQIPQSNWVSIVNANFAAGGGGGGGGIGGPTSMQWAELVCDSTCGNKSLSGLCFIDGINCSSIIPTVVLLTAQTNADQNGLWSVSTSGVWSRPTNYASGSTTLAINGMTIFVWNGLKYQGSIWNLYNGLTGTITIDSTPTTWYDNPPRVIATGTSVGRLVSARAADVANVLDYGATGTALRKNYGNGTGGINCTSGSSSITLNSVTVPYTSASALIPGCGNPGAVNSSNPGSASSTFTFSAAGTGYVPGEILTCSGGTQTTACQAVVYSTNVVAQPTLVSGGSGCTNNTGVTFTGTTGNAGSSGSGFFTITGNVSGNALTSITGYTANGPYWTNPTTITAEPVSGGGCSVAPTVSVTLGANLGSMIVAGNYTAVPSNPVSFTSSPGSGAQATFGTSPYWYGNPLVGTISNVVNSGGNSTFTISANAASTLTNGAGKVYLWINDDEPGIAAAIASGKNTLLFPTPPAVTGWETGYVMSTGVSTQGSHELDFNCQGNFLSGANASNISTAMLTLSQASAFRATLGSIVHNCHFDAAGNFARNITSADWDWIVTANSFENAASLNVAWAYGSGRAGEGRLFDNYIINDGYNPLTFPTNGIVNERPDERFEMLTMQGFQSCAINSTNGTGDAVYFDIHAYQTLEGPGVFCEYGAGNHWIANLADGPPPGAAGFYASNGYNTYTDNDYQADNGYQGQYGILLTSSSQHNSIVSGNFQSGTTPTKYACVDQSTNGNNYWGSNIQNCPNIGNMPAVPTVAGVASIPTYTGAITATHCAEWSALGILEDSGNTCGGGGGSPAFSSITAGTNTTAAMVVGSGSSLAPTGTGTIAATSLSALTGLPTIANNDILGNNSGSTAAPSALTGGNVQAILVAANFGYISDTPAAGPINDYSPTGFGNSSGWIDIQPATGGTTIDGLVAGVDGQAVLIANDEATTGTDNVTLVNQSSSDSTAANRFRAAGNLLIPPGGRVLCIYRTAFSRWSCQ